MRPSRSLTGGFALALAATLTLALSAQQPRRDPAGTPRDPRDPKASPNTASISGRVVALDTGQPLRRVRVSASSPEQARRAPTTMTDADGRYELKELAAGRYYIVATKGGFVALQYGQRGPRDRGRPIELSAGQKMEKVDLYLPRGGVITGRVVDEYGEPVTEANIHVLQYSSSSGRRRLMNMGRGAQTNDIGQFRVFGLAPGDYYVSASLPNFGLEDDAAPAPGAGYVATYYPGTTNPAEAQRVTLGIGEEAVADFQLSPTRVVRVSGTAVDSAGRPLDRGSVALITRGSVVTAPRSAPIRDGAFTVRDVTPGTYVLLLMNEMRVDDESMREVGLLPLTVGGDDISGLRLVTTPGATMRGRVTFEDGAPSTDRESVRVYCAPVDTELSIPGPRVGKMREDFTFDMRGLMSPCVISAIVSSASSSNRWHLKAVRQGGADVTDRPIEVSADKNPASVEIVMTTRVSTLTSMVATESGTPVKDYSLLVFPEDEAYRTYASRRIRTERPDQSGVCKVTGLPAADYLVIALENMENDTMRDPEMLAKLAPLATRVTLTEGGMQTLSLKLSAMP